jgi:beta-1,4-N-acetylglucosaminyltransferase
MSSGGRSVRSRRRRKVADGGRNVFITVGTTKFEKLIREIDSLECVKMFVSMGVTSIVCQIGHGSHVPFCGHGFGNGAAAECGTTQQDDYKKYLLKSVIGAGISIETFRHKPSIAQYIGEADVIIGHAGVGTIMETVRAEKPLLVIVNTDLMDNHQTEVAEEMSKMGHIHMGYPRTLKTILATENIFKVTPYPRKDLGAFPKLLDDLMGF